MKCLLCERNSAEESHVSGKDEGYVECPICGNYYYDGFFRQSYEEMDVNQKYKFSAYTRLKHELGGDPPTLGDPDAPEGGLDAITELSIADKIGLMLAYLRKESEHFGHPVSWDDDTDFPITASPNSTETRALRKAAEKEGKISNLDEGRVVLEKSGWEEGEKILSDLKEKVVLSGFEWM